MKKHDGRLRRSISLILTLGLILSSVGMAYAVEDESVSVNAILKSESRTEEEVIIEEIKPETDNSGNVITDDDGNVSYNINGNPVNAEAIDSHAAQVVIEKDVEVKNYINASPESGMPVVVGNARDNGTVDIQIGGSVTVNGQHTTDAVVGAAHDNGTVSIEIGKDVKATTNGDSKSGPIDGDVAGGIRSEADGTSSQSSVIVNGSIEVAGVQGAVGAQAVAGRENTGEENGKAAFDVKGDIIAKSTITEDPPQDQVDHLYVAGVELNAEHGGTAIGDVAGDITVSVNVDTGKTDLGMDVNGASIYNAGGTTELTVKGNVTSDVDGVRVNQQGYYYREEELESRPELSSNSYIEEDGEWNERVDYNAEKNVERVIKASGQSWYDPTTGRAYRNYKEWYADSGDIITDEWYELFDDKIEDDSKIVVEVDGDISAENNGLVLDLDNADGTVNIQIGDATDGGTLSGGERAILVQRDTGVDNLTLTVWKVEVNERGNIAETETWEDDAEEPEYTRAEEVEKKIQYIIRVDQPSEGATLSLQGTELYNGMNVAHESDTVVLKINVADGFELSGAFNGTEEKVSLLRDSNGDYYIVVPKGGGVLLSVTVQRTAVNENTQTEQQVTAADDTAAQQTAEQAAIADDTPAQPAAVQVAAVVQENPEIQVMNQIRDLLKFDDDVIRTNVTITLDRLTGERTVHIAPNESADGRRTMSLSVNAELLDSLDEINATTIEVSGESGNNLLVLPTQVIRDLLNPGETFVMEMEEKDDYSEDEMLERLMMEYGELYYPVSEIHLAAEDAQGNRRVISSSPQATIIIQEPRTGNAQFIYVDENGNEALITADRVNGSWSIIFQGNGTYAAVNP